MTPTEFIDNKAPQLAQYGKALLSDQLDFNEVQLYLWDTLEEWQQFNHQGDAQSDMERVFWHLLHAFDRWPDWMFRGNQYMRKQVDECCDYLNLGGQVPNNCIGIRPNS